jgi:hypothetical protein
MPANTQLIYYIMQDNFVIEFISLNFIDLQSIFLDESSNSEIGKGDMM